MPDVGVCQGEESVIQIIDYDKQSPGTTYKLVLDRDGTRDMTQQEVENMGGFLSIFSRRNPVPSVWIWMSEMNVPRPWELRRLPIVRR